MVELIPYDKDNYTNLIKTSPRFPVNAPSINSSVFASCKILFIGCYNVEYKFPGNYILNSGKYFIFWILPLYKNVC